MHELSIATELVARVEEVARREGASRIARIEVRIGAFSGVDREAFAFAFPFAAEGSRAAGAALAIEEQPLVVKCRACGESTNPEYPLVRCAACASGDVAIVSGEEFGLVAVEVE
jgi:hydrogenase nickel incorporation protein HypA/HybF